MCRCIRIACVLVCACVWIYIASIHANSYIRTPASTWTYFSKQKSMWAYTYCEYPCSCIYITYTLYHQIEMGAWVFFNHVHPQSRWNYFFSRTIVNQIFHAKSRCHTENHTRIFFLLRSRKFTIPCFVEIFDCNTKKNWLKSQKHLG